MTKVKVDKEKLIDIRNSPPSLIIGKNGWEAIVDELKRRIKKHKLVKVKISRNARIFSREEIAQKLADATRSQVVEIRGYQVIFYKR
ncbi:MAG: YhbY family RNA-binding protein [Candidatus Helarchaeota archaeon]